MTELCCVCGLFEATIIVDGAAYCDIHAGASHPRRDDLIRRLRETAKGLEELRGRKDAHMEDE